MCVCVCVCVCVCCVCLSVCVCVCLYYITDHDVHAAHQTRLQAQILKSTHALV